MDFDIVIRNGHIIDGAGNPWFKADIGIKEGKIAKLVSTPLKRADRVIDAKGLIVCPGFINLHSHSDSTILTHNNAENCLAMGLVTELTGHCGNSVAPIIEKDREALKERLKRQNLIDVDVDWLTLEKWMKKLEKKGIGINVATLVGQGRIRSSVMGVEGEGGEKIVPTDDQMNEMKIIIDKAMKSGAFGLSTGLIYAPGRNTLTNEIIELCKVVGKYRGIYASHIRDEGDAIIESVKEFIDICERSRVRGILSHHKVHYNYNIGKSSETIRLIENARARGIDVIIDQYPWRYGGGNKNLSAIVGLKSLVKSREELIGMLKDPTEWEKLKVAAIERREKEIALYKERKRKLEEKSGWTRKPPSLEKSFIIYSKTHQEFERKFLNEIKDAMEVGDIWEAVRVLLIDDEGYTRAYSREPFGEDDVFNILRYPWTAVSTDSSAWDKSKIPFQVMADALYNPHPRGYGTYPKILGKYVRDESVLTLEEAIRKMTSLPAGFLGLQDRGIVRENFCGDLVIFDIETVKNKATYGNPSQFPEGIHYVLVNGQLAIDEGNQTGALGGKVLRYNA